MEAISLFLGILLMLVVAVGIVFYVALVITIPVWRLLDWLIRKQSERANGSVHPAAGHRPTRWLATKLAWISSLTRFTARQREAVSEGDEEWPR